MAALQYYRLHCRECRWASEEPQGDLIRRIRAAGKLRAHTLPDDDTLAALLPALVAQLPCPECGEGRLILQTLQDDWPEPKRCEACGRQIPEERLQAAPDARFCATCQATIESGGEPATAEYCPRCGAPMRLQSTQRGVTRYRWVCTNTPPCRL